MEKIKNLSLRKSIFLYLSICLLASFLTAVITIRSAEMVQNRIWSKYIDQDEYMHAIEGEKGNYQVEVPRISKRQMSRWDGHIVELCDHLETFSVLYISIAGCMIAVMLFYRNKVKRPLQELERASERIAGNDLDFSIDYSNHDELGRLCENFEKMRESLEENSRKMWRMIEQEQALRAAVAHDIRAPLSVMKGYQEMLLEFVPEETLDKEKIAEMVKEGMNQINRMEAFIESMRKLTSLEERKIQYQKIAVAPFLENLVQNLSVLGKNTDKDCDFRTASSLESASFDKAIVFEVIENIFENAVRFAKRKVFADICINATTLEVTVSDDGPGFQEAEEIVTKPYYHANPQGDLKHFGLGLYISRLYCEKHGGRLLIGPAQEGGASVKAVFAIK